MLQNLRLRSTCGTGGRRVENLGGSHKGPDLTFRVSGPLRGPDLPASQLAGALVQRSFGLLCAEFTTFSARFARRTSLQKIPSRNLLFGV